MRILVLHQGLLAQECADLLIAAGHDVFLAAPDDSLFASELERAEALFSINLHAPLLKAAARRRIPYAAWIVDPLVNRAKLADEKEAATGFCRLFSYDREQTALYRSMGFTPVEDLPTGAAPAFCEAPPAAEEERDVDVGFVGTPLVERTNEFAAYRKQLEGMIAAGKDDRGYFKRFLEIADACVAEQAREMTRFVVPDRFAALEREKGIQVISPDWTPEKWQLVLSMSKEAARSHRVGLARAMARFGVTVWGPPEWTQTLVPGMAYDGPADYPGGTLDAYRRTKVNLGVTRIYAGDVIANRVWDILACGGFLLTDYRPELEKHLKIGTEIACYKTPEEAVALAKHYLDHPEERHRIAEAGRKAVLARHTLAQRIERILTSLQDR